MLRKKLLVAFALVGLLPMAPASPAPAQTVTVEVCQCGVLITKLVRANVIKTDEEAQIAWLLCIEEMC